MVGKPLGQSMQKRPGPVRRGVDVRRLKGFALTLPKGSALRDLLLIEGDDLDTEEFIAKMDDWLKLLRRGSA